MVTVADVARLLGGKAGFGRTVHTFADFGSAIAAGFPSAALQHVLSAGDVTAMEIADWLRISGRTLMRLKKRERLPADESDKLYRFVYIIASAENALGNRDRAYKWLRRENGALGGAIPLSLISTEPGLREVEQVLGRIEYGTVSSFFGPSLHVHSLRFLAGRARDSTVVVGIGGPPSRHKVRIPIACGGCVLGCVDIDNVPT
jgi:putative toxin-antitoxin system antitoxin component (TIGR02293 family)